MSLDKIIFAAPKKPGDTGYMKLGPVAGQLMITPILVESINAEHGLNTVRGIRYMVRLLDTSSYFEENMAAIQAFEGDLIIRESDLMPTSSNINLIDKLKEI